MRTDTRKIWNLKDGWFFGKSREGCGEAVTLPHTWNAVDGQDGGNDYYRGCCWYRRELTAEETNASCLFLEFNGAAHICDVYLDGEKLAHHEGGYSAFRVELTGKTTDKNLLEVSLSNEDNDRVYPQKADFTFYGGLYRDVNLICVPEEHFELLKDGTPGIKVTPVVDLEKKTAHVTVETWHNASSVARPSSSSRTCIFGTAWTIRTFIRQQRVFHPETRFRPALAAASLNATRRRASF